jgi:hypothetical protein
MELEEIVKERIKENEKLFSKEELKTIENNIILTKKVYMIGLVNGKQIYGK